MESRGPHYREAVMMYQEFFYKELTMHLASESSKIEQKETLPSEIVNTSEQPPQADGKPVHDTKE